LSKMALDFPDSPNDGQVFSGFTWDNTAGLWRVRGNALSPAGVSGVTGTVATTTDGNDTIYSFTGDGTITIATGGIANILLVGGGGSGAHGGGGAGGVLYLEDAYLGSGALTVTIGAGGVPTARPSSTYFSYGDNGKPSSIGDYYVPGGASGGALIGINVSTNNYIGYSGYDGSSGGGGSTGNSGTIVGTGGAGVSGIGNNGGNTSASILTCGGGGGAGAAGDNASGTTPGNGGAGVANSITGSSVTYGGGGGGHGFSAASTGGAGGGGAGVGTGYTGNGGNGTDGLGGGGGGGSRDGIGGTGGSGIVIVRILG
jgi:hypothetical protein